MFNIFKRKPEPVTEPAPVSLEAVEALIHKAAADADVQRAYRVQLARQRADIIDKENGAK